MFNSIFTEILNLAKESKFEDALSLIEKLENESSVSPIILVLKGIYIQLLDNTNDYQLSDAESAYKKALAMQDNHIEALYELGMFHLNVNDDPNIALPFFEKAMDVCSNVLTDVILGKAQCLAETQSKDSAIKFIQQYTILKDDKINEFINELNQ